MKHEDTLSIQAWMDGEISPEKSGQIAELVETDADAKAVAREIQHITKMLKFGEKQVSLEESREFYWAQVERQIIAEDLVKPVINQPKVISAGEGNLLRWLIPTGSLCIICVFLGLFWWPDLIGYNIRSSSTHRPHDAEISGPTSGQTEPAGLYEKENPEAGVGVFNFDSIQGSHNFSSPEDPSALPESIENPER
jgi:hypothetical protein